ncbi:MAG: zinc ribbon domain-containing protein [Sedimentisphaerales bacterium]|nr:zinc ribbon domain-containing protein [Sedimentisphaerales bacterium]
MPIYEFVCEKCGYGFEKLVASMKSSGTMRCPQCDGKANRQVSVFSAHSSGNRTACGDGRPCCGIDSAGDCVGGGCPLAKR